MASLIEVFKDGKIVSYRMSCCVGRDERGKQLRRSMTWKPPDGLRQSRMRAAAERAADEWEEAVRAEYAAELERMSRPDPGCIPPDERRDDFVEYVNNVWYKLYICNGDRKRTTEAYYADLKQYITAYFSGAVLQDITSIQIEEYLQHLRKEHERKKKKPLSQKYLHHQYGALLNIFEYASKHKMISENPMDNVEAPKMKKKKVDAMNEEQAKVFFSLADNCAADLRCMLYLLTTTGVRRGELVGLKWRDIDTDAAVLHVERGVAYTHKTGVVTSTPKTPSSIRDIPLMPATVDVLNRYKRNFYNKCRAMIHKVPPLLKSLIEIAVVNECELRENISLRVSEPMWFTCLPVTIPMALALTVWFSDELELSKREKVVHKLRSIIQRVKDYSSRIQAPAVTAPPILHVTIQQAAGNDAYVSHFRQPPCYCRF